MAFIEARQKIYIKIDMQIDMIYILTISTSFKFIEPAVLTLNLSTK